MKLPRLNHYLLEVVFILLMGLIPLLWFKPGYLAAGHDMSYPLAPIDFWQDRLFAWTDRIGTFGSNQTNSISGIFIHGIEAVSIIMGLSLRLSQQISFVFWFILPGITMYILLRSFYPKNEDWMTRLSGSSFYMLNHYLLQGWVIAERTKFSIVAALPLVVLVIVNVVYRRKSILKQALILGLILFFLNGGAGIPLWGGVAIVSLSAIFSFSFHNNEHLLLKFGRVLRFLALSLLILGFLNFYWLYPYLKSLGQNYAHWQDISGGSAASVTWSQYISANTSFLNLIKLQGIPDWYDNPEHPYAKNFLNNPFLILSMAFFPIIAFIGLLRSSVDTKEDCVYKSFFLTVLVVGIPLAAGSHFPFGFIYDYFLGKIPWFSIFRTPIYKFGMAIWFAYAGLVALGVRYLSKKINISFIRSFIPLFFLLILLINNYPALTGSFFNWSRKYSTMVKIPNYVFEVKSKLDGNKFSTRALLLPDLDPRTEYEVYDWKYFSLSPLVSMLSRRPVLINDAILSGPELEFVNQMYNQLRRGGKSNILPLFGVDSVFVRHDFSPQEDSAFSVNSILSKIPSGDLLNDVPERLGRWDYYRLERQNIRPLISLPEAITYISSNPGNFAIAADIPGIDLGEALVLGEINKPLIDILVDYPLASYIIQGECDGCDKGEKVDAIINRVPRILPGTKFYWILQLLDKRRKDQLTDPGQLIDFSLGNMVKKSAAINTSPEIGIKIIFTEWKEALIDIEMNHSKILDREKKTFYSKKIYEYLGHILNDNRDWREAYSDSDLALVFDEFRESVYTLLDKLDLTASNVVGTTVRGDKSYSFVVPKTGKYKLSFYSPQTRLEETSNLEVFVDGKRLKLERTSALGWFQFASVELTSGRHIAITNSDFNSDEVLSIKDLKLLTDRSKFYCYDLNVDRVNFKNKYSITFKYYPVVGNILSTYLIEKSKRFPKGKSGTFYRKSTKLPDGSFEFEGSYFPGKEADTFLVRFCLDSFGQIPSLKQVSDFRVTESSPDPILYLSSSEQSDNLNTSTELEFVAINQTKYLVKVGKFTGRKILSLNSRFEQNWSIREVESSLAQKYFVGETRKYDNDQVTEYSRQDKHLISDLVFPKNKLKTPDHLVMGPFSNGWLLTGDSGKVYLVEYLPQNLLYKSGLITGLTFLAVVLLLVYIKKYD